MYIYIEREREVGGREGGLTHRAHVDAVSPESEPDDVDEPHARQTDGVHLRIESNRVELDRWCGWVMGEGEEDIYVNNNEF